MLKKFDETTKQYKLFQALVLNGETLTEAAITNRFGIKNPTATISTIRQRGFAVYAKSRKAGNGVQSLNTHTVSHHARCSHLHTKHNLWALQFNFQKLNKSLL